LFMTKHIAVFHASLSGLGGAERLALTVMEGLKGAGYYVDLISLEKVDWKKMKNIAGFSKSDIVDEVTVIPPFKVLPTIYSAYLNWLLLGVLAPSMLKLQRRYDLTILTSSLPLPTFVDIQYLHFPDYIPELLLLYHRKYVEGLSHRVYFGPYKLLSKALDMFADLVKYRPLLLTNSKFSKMIIERFLGVDAVVLYPPVKVKKYLCTESSLADRKNIVVTVSRIEVGKHLEVVLEIAKRVKDAKFVVIGATRQPSYVHRLRMKAVEMGISDKIIIVPNADESLKTSLMRKAKLYLHPTKFEHFGISIVEAMASGLVPIVHRSGGPWMDILGEKQGVFGYAYNDVDEATQVIAELLVNNDLRIEIAKRIIYRAETYDENIFKRKIVSVAQLLSGAP